MTNDSIGGIGGLSLFDLFRSEVEAHCADLSAGLLAIERGADGASGIRIEPLMRCAHSVKGAARVVGLDLIVELAHAMEDCLVAAQRGKLKLDGARIDLLLGGVDSLVELGKIEEVEVPQWMNSRQPQIGDLVARMRAAYELGCAEATSAAAELAACPAPKAPPIASAGAASKVPAPAVACAPAIITAPATAASSVAPVEPACVATPTATQPGLPSAAQAPSEAEPAGKPGAMIEGRPIAPTDANGKAPVAEPSGGANGTVRVSTANLTRLVGLSSEAIIESRRLGSIRSGIARVRESQRRLESSLDRLRRSFVQGDITAGQNHLGEAEQRAGDLLRHLLEQTGEIEHAVRRSEEISKSLHSAVLASRMRPFGDGAAGLPRAVRDACRKLGKEAQVKILGGAVSVDRDILAALEAPLTHMVRNAVDHGLESPEERVAAGKPRQGTIQVEVRHHSGMLRVQVSDDGRGVDGETVRARVIEKKLVSAEVANGLAGRELFDFLFLPGFSTRTDVTEYSGRGVGLDVVQTMVQEVGGRVSMDSESGRGTRVVMQLPVSLSVVRAAVVEVGESLIAFPLSRLVRILQIPSELLSPVQGRMQFQLDNVSVGLVHTADLLGLERRVGNDGTDLVNILVVGDPAQPCGLVIDKFRGELDLVVRTLDERLGKVPHISAASVLETGETLFIVDTDDLVAAVQQLLGDGRLQGSLSAERNARSKTRRILVVDDSITVREVQRQILTRLGFKVDLAVDGRDGWNALRTGKYDLLVTDIDMPRMNGIELIRAVRADAKSDAIPIVVVSYKGRDEDRMLGLDAGANAYLTKGSFQDNTYVQTITDLVSAVTGGDPSSCESQSSMTCV